MHTRRRLAGPATKRLKPACLGARRRPSRALLRRNGRTVWDTARRARTSKRGMCYVEIGCALARGCRGVLSRRAPRRDTVRTWQPARSDPPSTTVHRSARVRLSARTRRADQRAARVLVVDGRAEKTARVSESRGADDPWAAAHTPNRARRPRVDAVRGERAPAGGGGGPMLAAALAVGGGPT